MGLIPASGETTRRAASGSRGSRAHPRERGDDPARASLPDLAWGSSPRAGRRPSPTSDHHRAGGLIPASGETTPAPARPSAGTAAHPRERGDDGAFISPTDLQPGSSPRAGRRLTHDRHIRHRLGLIPASGETTSTGTPLRPRPQAHPRERGDDVTGTLSIGGDGGSSPRAGRRRRGRVPDRRLVRLIPASGETTSLSSTRTSAPGAHPRERGDDSMRSHSTSPSAGSSPRAGRRRRDVVPRPASVGLIPASGETTAGSG